MATTEKQFIAKVANAYALTANSDAKDFDLAVYILKNYYAVDSFFPNKEGDYESGINLGSLHAFSSNMAKVIKAINGEG